MKITLTLLLLITLSLAQNCQKGGLRLAQGQCIYPRYIEGCQTYSKNGNTCETCQFNYQISNGFCYYSPKDTNNCCQKFDNQGRCLQCISGFVINQQSGVCQDRKIPGCLQKNNLGCIVCAQNFDLISGVCVPQIPGCINYNNDFSCSLCQNGKQVQGQSCVPILNIRQIPNCQVAGDSGCSRCMNGYKPNNQGGCNVGIYGCQAYSNDICIKCDMSYSVLVNGQCKIYGCTNSNNGRCTACDSSRGFQLADGRCRINNCVYLSERGCLNCYNGLMASTRGCVNIQDNPVCKICKPNQYQAADGSCMIKLSSCGLYQQGQCIQCADGYYLSANKQCILNEPGCLYSNGVCSSCSSPFIYLNQKCVINGCIGYSMTGCTACDSRLTLIGSICGLPNCNQLNNMLQCTQCATGYQPKNGRCQFYDPFCINFSPVSGCLRCTQNYQVVNGICSKISYGCVFTDGRCTSCKTPFIYQPQTQTCSIDGCTSYFFGGCRVCANGYDLRYNSCKLPNCLTSLNGKCLTCDPDYIFKSDGTCVNKDLYCDTYGNNGKCIKCMPNYYMSALKNKCVPRDPGCSDYDNKDNCIQCAKPFFFNNGRCDIVGCLSYTIMGCQTCKYPYAINTQKTCSLPFCTQYDENNRCSMCDKDHFLNKDLICQQKDPNCCKYDGKRTQCIQCIKGYYLDSRGKCQYGDQYCSMFEQGGICLSCDRLYFLNVAGKCQLMDPQCLVYTNGICSSCNSFYYPFKTGCVANEKGCQIQYTSDRCNKCSSGYQFKGFKCSKSIKKLTWNDINMDFTADQDAKQRQRSQSVFTMKFTSTQRLRSVTGTQLGQFWVSSTNYQNGNYSLNNNNANGWRPIDIDSYPFIGVQVNEPQTFYAIDIKIVAGSTLSRFLLQYSIDGKKFNSIKVFQWQQKVPGVIHTFYFKPVSARYIRLVPQQGIPHIKVQFYVSDIATLQSSKPITQQQQSYIEKSIMTSLEGSQMGGISNCGENSLCWAGVQACTPRNLSGLSLVYTNDSKQQFVTMVKIKYSVDGIKFDCYNNCQQLPLSNSALSFPTPIFAQKVRVIFTKYTGRPKFGINFKWL